MSRPLQDQAPALEPNALTEVQRAIVVGSLLGDGSMRCKANALLEINHSLAQRDYVDWKYEHLINLVGTPPKARRGNGLRVAYRFTTLSRPELTPFYRAFYELGRKSVPEIQLTPLTLAVWLMDDGSVSRSAVYLNTQQFDVESHAILIRALREQCGIRSTLNRDKCYQRIRISTDSISILKRLVGPYVVPSLEYKLPK